MQIVVFDSAVQIVIVVAVVVVVVVVAATAVAAQRHPQRAFRCGIMPVEGKLLANINVRR